MQTAVSEQQANTQGTSSGEVLEQIFTLVAADWQQRLSGENTSTHVVDFPAQSQNPDEQPEPALELESPTDPGPAGRDGKGRGGARWIRRIRSGWLVLCLLLAMGLLATAIPSSWLGRLSTAIGVLRSERWGKLRIKNIEDIRVGDRVLTDEERGDHDDSLGWDVDPATWSKLELRTRKRDGSRADIVLLRPKDWIQQHGAHVGGKMWVRVPECGLHSWAEVTAISSCPLIRSGQGRVVIGTFKHQSARIVDLYLEDEEESIGTTANHPFWSEDQQRFVAAEELSIGESLLAVSRTVRVREVVPRQQPEPVYNLEIQGTHTYHIASIGVLAHNGTAEENTRIPLLPDTYGVGKDKANGVSVIYEIRGELDGVETFYVGQMGFRGRWKKTQRYEKVRNLLLNGKNVTIAIRTIDYSGLADIMKTNNLPEEKARKYINFTAEYMTLEAAKKKAGITQTGGSNTLEFWEEAGGFPILIEKRTYRNLNDPKQGNMLGEWADANKPQEYIIKYGTTSDGKSRLSEVKERLPVCPG